MTDLLLAGLALPVVLLASLLRPIVLVHFGGLPVTAIGHLSSDPLLYEHRKAQGWYGRRVVTCWCIGTQRVCNAFLLTMWRRVLWVSPFFLACERVNRLLPGGRRNRIPFDWGPFDLRRFLVST